MKIHIPAKKSLGQNFLHNPQTVQHILDLADVRENDFILEIGPGPGLMTEALVARGVFLVCVEKDRRLATVLKERYAGKENVLVIEGDFLRQELETLIQEKKDRKMRVIANLPYYVATEILFHLMGIRDFISDMYLMFQKEVAERMVALPDSKAYGLLSVMVQLHADAKILMKLGPESFRPAPKVHSAVVAFSFHQQPWIEKQEEAVFRQMVRKAFGQRRKMLRTTLSNAQLPGEKIEKILGDLGIQPKARPENLSVRQWIAFMKECGFVSPLATEKKST